MSQNSSSILNPVFTGHPDVIYEILSFIDDHDFIIDTCIFISSGWLEAVKRLKLSIKCKNEKQLKQLVTNQFKIPIVSSINSLTCNNAGITSAGVECICELQNLTYLDITGNSILFKTNVQGFDCISELRQISKLQHLTHLAIAQNMLYSEQVKNISELKNLKYLDINNNSIRGIGVEYISKLQQLTYLNIADNDVADEGAKHTSKLQNLTHLDISNNNIKINGAKYISKLKTLTHLDVNNNQITQKGAKYISELEKLIHLGINSNKIGDEGVKYISELQTLEYLDIRNNSIGIEIQNIINLNQLTYLDLGDNIIRDEGIENISKLMKLTSLSINGNSITDRGVEYISKLTKLTYLDVNLNRIGDKSGEYISKLQNLTHLDITNTSMGVDGIEHITKLKNLKRLKSECVPLDSDVRYLLETFKYNHWFAEKPKKSYVDPLKFLISQPITTRQTLGEDIINLPRNVINTLLSFLDFASILDFISISRKWFDVVMASELAIKCNNIEQLVKSPFSLSIVSLVCNNLDANSFVNIGKLENLTYLDISKNMINKGIQNINKLMKLTHLIVSCNELDDTGVSHIASLKHLTCLDISDNIISDEGIQSISKLTELTNLDINNNLITARGMEYISKLTKLTLLNVSANRIGDKGAEYISRLENLMHLDIQHTSITNDGYSKYLTGLTPDCRIDIDNNITTNASKNIIQKSNSHPFKSTRTNSSIGRFKSVQKKPYQTKTFEPVQKKPEPYNTNEFMRDGTLVFVVTESGTLIPYPGNYQITTNSIIVLASHEFEEYLKRLSRKPFSTLEGIVDVLVLRSQTENNYHATFIKVL